MKKEIIRKCFGCRGLFDRQNMIKLTVQNGIIYVNPDSKTMGRSLYICKKEECVKNVIKKHLIKRNLKLKDDIQIEKIEKILPTLLN